MASNFFGHIFRITTFGESHGPAIGVVIDGCPSGISITIEEIQEELAKRKPGNSPYTSPRKESDLVEILSGVFEGRTTGTPLTLLLRNEDADSSQYVQLAHIYKPGHANFTYLEKYGIFDYRGGGRSSGRETAARVAAGAVAKKLLAHFGISCCAYLYSLGDIRSSSFSKSDIEKLADEVQKSSIFCPDPSIEKLMKTRIDHLLLEHDSIGGVVGCVANIPSCLGEPVYGKLEAELAYAMLSLPASKGFEIGEGFQSTTMLGSEHNDPFTIDLKGKTTLAKNSAGGTLGGISTGQILSFHVAFKPSSSIKKPQDSVSIQGEKTVFQTPHCGRHDPCVAIRAVPVIEAMTALVLADAVLRNRSAKI